MDCDVCNNLLLDLLYDDLDEVRAAATRRHMDGCPACRAAYDRLNRGHVLAQTYAPVDPQPPDEVLLAAIRASLERASAPPPMVEDPPAVMPTVIEPHPLRIPQWLRRVGEVAMRRQVAMAAVFLLMVGLGLRFYQYQPPPRAADTDISPAPEVIPAQEVHHPPSGPTPDPAAATVARRNTAPLQHVTTLSAATIDRRSATTVRAAPVPSAQYAQVAPSASSAPAATGSTSGSTSGSIGDRGLANAAIPVAHAVRRTESPTANPAPWHAQPQSPPDWQTPSTGRVAAVDRDLQQALPGAPQGSPLADASNAPVAPPWRTALTQANELRAHSQNDQAISAYRHALDLAPDAATRRLIATEFVPFLRNSGHAVEAQRVAGYLTVAPNDTSGLANAVPQGSAPHPATSMPHAAAARPARTRPPMPVGMDSNSQAGF